MKKPLISVVMSVYNGEKYLASAIESILTQTIDDFEFIIVNDGSNDSSLSIINAYAVVDCRIKLITRSNKGLINSLNEGLSISSGVYIARMDADDISIRNRFEKQIEFLESNPEVGVCGSWVEVFGEDVKSKVWKMPLENSVLKAGLIFSVPFAHPTVMMRKSIIDLHGLKYDLNYKDAEDYKFWLDFSKYTLFLNVPMVLLKYRYHQESISRQADKKKNQDRFQTISKIQTEALLRIGVELTDDERKILFIMSLNERILQNEIDIYAIKRLFAKITDLYLYNEDYTSHDLEKILARKYFIYQVLSVKRDRTMRRLNFFDAFFLKGGFQMIKEKLNLLVP
ncbi:glycosyltransferase [Marinomonas sp. ef1]|uniref:glycosyltransferase n=1 Tax=Marinomonas sp. ef1 TaxID=2005043 RepID=UPI000C2895D7|nr:glycosyltransferase [Marinomonas sp. ef1]